MKSLTVALILAVGLSLVLMARPAWSFNPLAHIYIAEHVFPYCQEKIDLYYGSTAPDIALHVKNPSGNWPTAFDDTHYEFIDLRPCAWSRKQRAFANAWLIHNEAWGADFHAHGNPSFYQGYVNVKAFGLLTAMKWANTAENRKFAHFAVEATIDLLLKREYDQRLGEKLFKATLLRSWQDRYLLTKVFVRRDGTTDWATLFSAELALRNLLARYALPLALPPPLDEKALIALGVQLAQEFYSRSISAEDLEEILMKATALCTDDYYPVIGRAVYSITDIVH